MLDSVPEDLTRSKKLDRLRKSWAAPDKAPWEFDGITESHDSRNSYDQEMSEGLDGFGCKTFDDLVLRLEKKLGRKPNVIDFMGGAYFLHIPENTNSLTGIRLVNRDEDFMRDLSQHGDSLAELTRKIIGSDNRKIVEADILSNSGWDTIKNQNLLPADLLVCRPVGPFDVNRSMGTRRDNPESFAGLYTALFNRMLSLVNRDGGMIFTEIPDIYSDEQVKRFFNETDNRESCYSWLFTVKDERSHWGGAKRRYSVVQFKKSKV